MNKFVIILVMAFALMSCESSVKNSELKNDCINKLAIPFEID